MRDLACPFSSPPPPCACSYCDKIILRFKGGRVPALQFPVLTKVGGNVVLQTSNAGHIQNIKFNALKTVKGHIKIRAATSNSYVGNVFFPALTLVDGDVLLGSAAGSHNGNIVAFSANTDSAADSLEINGRLSIKTTSSSGSVGSVYIGAMHLVGQGGTGSEAALDVFASGATIGSMDFNRR